MKQTDIQSFFHMQMPRWLFFDTRYNTMSLEAKVAYTFLLNRFQLSKLNGWINPDGEVFIIYTRSSLSDEMQISYRKVISAMRELSSSKLIYERRCGRGDANQIYLARVELMGEHDSGCESAPFVSEQTRSADMACLDDGVDVDDVDGVDGVSDGHAPRAVSTVPLDAVSYAATDMAPPVLGDVPQDFGKDAAVQTTAPAQASDDTDGDYIDSPAYQYSPVYRDSLEYQLVSGSESQCTDTHDTQQDMQYPHIKNCKNGTSRDTDSAHQDMRNRHTSNTDVSNTEKSDIYISQSVSNARERDRPDGDEIQELDDILDGCELWTFPNATAQVFENAIERLFFSERFKIGNAVLPRKKIRSHLHQLDSVRLQDAAHKLAENKERKIKNSTAYVMAVVFNSIWETDSDVLCDPYINSMRT
jgi:hypothetical protein